MPLPTPGQVKHTGVHCVKFQDKWLGAVVMQWQVPLQVGCLRRLGKNSTYFLREAGWILLRALVSGSHSPRCLHVSPLLLSEEFHIPAARRENLDIISTRPSFSADVTFQSNDWLYSGYMFCVSLRELMAFGSHILRGGELGSGGRFLSCSPVIGECAQSMLQSPYSRW